MNRCISILLLCLPWLFAISLQIIYQSAFWRYAELRDSLLPFQPGMIAIGISGNILLTLCVISAHWLKIPKPVVEMTIGISIGFWIFGVLCVVLSFWGLSGAIITHR